MKQRFQRVDPGCDPAEINYLQDWKENLRPKVHREIAAGARTHQNTRAHTFVTSVSLSPVAGEWLNSVLPDGKPAVKRPMVRCASPIVLLKLNRKCPGISKPRLASKAGIRAPSPGAGLPSVWPNKTEFPWGMTAKASPTQPGLSLCGRALGTLLGYFPSSPLPPLLRGQDYSEGTPRRPLL